MEEIERVILDNLCWIPVLAWFFGAALVVVVCNMRSSQISRRDDK